MAGEVSGSSGAPCRDYIDPLTQLIYYYDCNTGVLTPETNPMARADIYNRICAEPRGSTFCDGFGPATTACTWDWCVSYLAADTGIRDVTVDITAHTTICGNPESIWPVGHGAVAVTYAEGAISGNGPCSGLVDAKLLLDGVVVSESMTNY